MNTPIPTSCTKKQHYWLTHLHRIATEQQGIASYARTHKLQAQALHRWKHRLKKKGLLDTVEHNNQDQIKLKPTMPATTAWIQASITDHSEPINQVICRIKLQHGTTIDIHQHIEAQQLTLLMQQLAATS